MFFRILNKESVGDLISGFAQTREVIAPRAKGSEFVFDVIENLDDIVLDYTTTLLPPKKYFLKSQEPLMRYNTRTGESSEEDAASTPRVLFGVHPCDIHSLLLIDKVFLGDYEDPYYKARRENTLIVGVSCMPTPLCMCNAFGTGEVHDGFDLFLTDLGDRYYVTCQTAEGAHYLNKYCETRAVEKADVDALQTHIKEFNDAFEPAPDMAEIPLLFDAKYNDPMWEEIGDACLSCGACSMVCPTCYCFNVRDIQDADGVTGTRVREWDSCCFSDFAEVVGGHNFRPKRSDRVKYRFYHKQWGYLSRYGESLCVGCGRCNKACKVNINPRRVLTELTKGGDK